ncbi:hypothetical protein [Spirosoma harenae]
METTLQLDLLRLLKKFELLSTGYKGNAASYATNQLRHVLEKNGVVPPEKQHRKVELIQSGKVIKTFSSRSDCASYLGVTPGAVSNAIHRNSVISHQYQVRKAD